MSARARVLQWSVMSRHWLLYDCNQQCAMKSSDAIAYHLRGLHKPIYHPLSDIGDHVVVINTKYVAMKDDYWRKYRFYHHTRYPGGFSVTSAWRLHEMQPTKIIEKLVYQRLRGNLTRHTLMRRLHLFPDDNVPEHIIKNVSDQIRQIQPVPKRLDEYTEEEVCEYPKLFDWPETHVFIQGNKKPKPESE